MHKKKKLNLCFPTTPSGKFWLDLVQPWNKIMSPFHGDPLDCQKQWNTQSYCNTFFWLWIKFRVISKERDFTIWYRILFIYIYIYIYTYIYIYIYSNSSKSFHKIALLKQNLFSDSCGIYTRLFRLFLINIYSNSSKSFHKITLLKQNLLTDSCGICTRL